MFVSGEFGLLVPGMDADSSKPNVIILLTFQVTNYMDYRSLLQLNAFIVVLEQGAT